MSLLIYKYLIWLLYSSIYFLYKLNLHQYIINIYYLWQTYEKSINNHFNNNKKNSLKKIP